MEFINSSSRRPTKAVDVVVVVVVVMSWCCPWMPLGFHANFDVNSDLMSWRNAIGIFCSVVLEYFLKKYELSNLQRGLEPDQYHWYQFCSQNLAVECELQKIGDWYLI